MEDAPTAEAPLLVDRYAIYDAIASGGMATVHLGRLIGNAGFLRTVAIKRLHAQFAHDEEFTSMLLDEARLASRIQHPNVVSTLDVVMKDEELLLVMEYVRGESLSRLVRRARDRGEPPPPRVVVGVLCGALHGLHAAHEAVNEKGQPLGLVHRDMSPQNVLVGVDGIARVLDFGVAKAAGRVHTTRDGDIKGKVLYMPPEQLSAQPLTRTADVYAAGVVLFETLTCVRMFAGENEGAALAKIIRNEVRMPSEIDPALAKFDPIVRRATAAESSARYPTALDMATDLETLCGPPASAAEISAWVQRLASEILDERARIVAEIERSSTRSKPPLAIPSSGFVKVGKVTAAVDPPSAVSSARPRSPVLVGIAGLLVVLVGLLVVIAFLLGRAPVSVATTTGMVAPPVPSTAAAPVVAPAPTEDPVANAVVIRRPDPAPSAAASATATATSTGATSARPVGRGRINCDPPYVIDKNGHQHFIPECLK